MKPERDDLTSLITQRELFLIRDAFKPLTKRVVRANYY